MNYYLMFHLDRIGNVGIILKHSNDLRKMDNYIKNFASRNEVFDAYREDIQEFCLDEMKRITEENKRNKHNRTGSISLFCRYQNNNGTFMYKIPIMYKNDNELLDSIKCLKKIKEKLNENQVLEKVFKEKRFLLSMYEFDLISNYYKFQNEKYKKDFIETFINRLKKFNSDKQYFFFRSLMNVCSLNQVELKISRGIVKNVNLKMPLQTTLTLSSTSKEARFDDDNYLGLIESQNYEELHKYYDLDKILKDTKRK